MKKILTLGAHFEKFVADQVAIGRYKSESEAIRAVVQLLEEHQRRLKELRAMVDQGDDDIGAGRTTRIVHPAAFAAKLAARSEARAAAKKTPTTP